MTAPSSTARRCGLSPIACERAEPDLNARRDDLDKSAKRLASALRDRANSADADASEVEPAPRIKIRRLSWDNDRMAFVSAFVWRGGAVSRAVTVGLGVGLFLGAPAWLDSGVLVGGIIAMVIISIGFGVWLAHQMARTVLGQRI